MFSCTSPERKTFEFQERIYNQHTRLLSSESWSVCAAKSTRAWGGADVVIQSIALKTRSDGRDVKSPDFDTRHAFFRNYCIFPHSRLSKLTVLCGISGLLYG